MLKEIGSEFWNTEQDGNYKIEFSQNQIFMLSGRTALDFIIRDIKAIKSLQTVYLPSYCCHTMIEPFISNGAKVYFYDVSVKETGGFQFDIDYNLQCDAVYLIQYFGYQDNQIEAIAKQFKDRGITVIEDITHSLFTEKSHNQYDDYVFGSLRKWTGLYTGGIAAKMHEEFTIKVPTQTNEEYYQLRKYAAKLKSDYIEKGFDNKAEFLDLFNKAEKNLEKDYINYSIDDTSLKKLEQIDITYLKQKRQENAEMILKSIIYIGFIKPIFNMVTYNDTPLFVPVMIDHSIRDEFRKYLIKNRIYCPVHWAISELHNISNSANDLYNNVLSLVCDQRYGKEEMQYFIEKINEFRA